MTDEQLCSMTVDQLRARFNSAPVYLQSLLARKRKLEEGVLWEFNLQQRAQVVTHDAADAGPREQRELIVRRGPERP